MSGNRLDPWHGSGIAACGDERAIRRADARRPEQCRTEGDPESFQRLRRAGELSRVRAKAARSMPAIAPPPSPAQPVPPTRPHGHA